MKSTTYQEVTKVEGQAKVTAKEDKNKAN